MRVYHYTTDINWRKICEGAKDFSYEVYPSYALDELFADAGQLENFKLKNNRYVDSQLVRGCWPSERFSYNAVCENTEEDKLSRRPGNFALLEPLPESWDSNPVMPGQLRRLFGKICGGLRVRELVLLAFDLTKTDQAFVADWVEKSYDPARPGSLRESANRYLANRIPLQNYISSQFLCPEVVILNPIPLSRINKLLSLPINGDEDLAVIQEQLRARLPELGAA